MCRRIKTGYSLVQWAGYLSRYSDWLRAGRSGYRIPVGARFSAPVQTGPGAHPLSCTMCTGSFPGVKSGRGVKLTPHPLLVPWSKKSRAIPLLPLWVVLPVQSLSACTRVHFTFTFTCKKYDHSSVWLNIRDLDEVICLCIKPGYSIVQGIQWCLSKLCPMRQFVIVLLDKAIRNPSTCNTKPGILLHWLLTF